MSNPAISGTNYAVVNALLQTKGQDEGWKYFEALNKNVDYYSKRGSDPSTKTAAGEVGIGITYINGTLDELKEQADVDVIYPSDGMPYVPEGVAHLQMQTIQKLQKHLSNGSSLMMRT